MQLLALVVLWGTVAPSLQEWLALVLLESAAGMQGTNPMQAVVAMFV